MELCENIRTVGRLIPAESKSPSPIFIFFKDRFMEVLIGCGTQCFWLSKIRSLSIAQCSFSLGQVTRVCIEGLLTPG